MQWVVYILFCDQKTFYVGMTDNLERRIFEHIHRHSPYTKKFSDIELIYSEPHTSRASAAKRELQIKGWSAAKKKALVDSNKQLLISLSKSTVVVGATNGAPK